MSEFAQGTGPGQDAEQHVRRHVMEQQYEHPAGPEENRGAHGPDSGSGPGREVAGEADVASVADVADGADVLDAAPERGEGDGQDVGPRPLGVGVRPTGHAPVDAQLRRLEDADHLAVSGHLEVYEDVHRGLRETLAALDRPHTPGAETWHDADSTRNWSAVISRARASTPVS